MEAADEDAEVEAEHEPPWSGQDLQPVDLCKGVDTSTHVWHSNTLYPYTLYPYA